MKFDIITLFPEMFSAIKEEGVIARAMKKSLISINTWQLRDFSSNKYKNVDEKPYGGGVMGSPGANAAREILRDMNKSIESHYL